MKRHMKECMTASNLLSVSQAQANAARQRRADAAALAAAEVKAGGGQAGIDNALKQRYGGRMPSGRQQARHSSRNLATRSVAATGRKIFTVEAAVMLL